MSGEEASGGDKPNFAGKYVLVRNENFDDFLAANGITLIIMIKQLTVSAGKPSRWTNCCTVNNPI